MSGEASANELDEALRTFDRVGVNLTALEEVWQEMAELVDVASVVINFEDATYDELLRQFDDLASSLPPIGGYLVSVRPLRFAEVAQWRMDTIDVPEALPDLLEAIREPGEGIAGYRHRLTKERRALVRQRVDMLIAEIDRRLAELVPRHVRTADEEGDDERWGARDVTGDADWVAMDAAFSELFRLLGEDELRGSGLNDLQRHLRFGQGVDLRDIAERDWPAVKPRIERALYAEREPLPVAAVDLSDLVASRPSGPVPTRLDFSSLTDDRFEGLIYALLSSTEGYENANWLMETRAPDRGRDLEVHRVNVDALTGTTRDRVIVQCKAWKKSLSPTECAAAVAPLPLWEPPPVDVLVIATTGRFSAGAVQWIEAHNNAGKRPRIQAWADSTLERMLAARNDLVTQFELRR